MAGPARRGACAGPLTRTALTDPLSRLELIRHDCRNCGTVRLQPASPVGMTVTVDALTITGADTGEVLISCAYKGFPGTATARHDLAAGPAVALPVPAGLPPELRDTTRTVRAVFADGAEVHAWKERR